MDTDPKDRLFCEIAVDFGILTEEQVQVCLEKQMVDRAIGEIKPIGAYLFEEKIITKDQILQILKLRKCSRGSAPT